MNGLLLQHAGQGDAFILPTIQSEHVGNVMQQMAMAKKLKEGDQDKLRAERDKKLDELSKWNPDAAWYPHTKQVEKKVQDVYDYNTELKKIGKKPTPEQEDKLIRMKRDAEIAANKSKDLKQLYPQLRSQIGQTDKYTDQGYLHSKLNDEIFGMGEKDVNEVDFDKLNNLVNDPKAFKIGEYTKDFAKSLPNMVDSTISTLNAEGGAILEDKEVKSKFFDLDQNGNVKIDPRTGSPKIKITPETTSLFLKEPRVQAYLEEEKLKPENKYATDTELVSKLLAPYASREERVSVKKGYSDKQAKGDDNVLAVNTDVTRNRNIYNQESKKYSTESGWVPKEVDLNPEKFKNILINPSNTVNVENNQENNTKRAANEPYTLTKVLLLPVDAKTGQRIHGEKNKVLKHQNGIVYKTFVEGVRNYEENDEKKRATEIFPVEQVKSFLDAKGVDLSKYGFNDPLGIGNSTQEKDPLGILK